MVAAGVSICEFPSKTGLAEEQLATAVNTCKKVLLDDFSQGIEHVLYEFSVKTRADMQVLQDDGNSRLFDVLMGQPKKYTVEQMKNDLAGGSLGPSRRYALERALLALQTGHPAFFVLILEVHFEEMTEAAYIVDVDIAGKYVCPDHFIGA
jgi:hypothetical protein